ncbi:MAG: M36 family metallopeptidase, partial [Actinomycetota bacterium]
MIRHGRRFSRARKALGLFFAIVMVLSIATVPATGRQGRGHAHDPSTTWSFQVEHDHDHDDIDNRAGVRRPTRAQRRAVSALGAEVAWNDLGTPRSLIKHGGWLAKGLGSDAEEAARRFISDNRALFLLSATGVADLELIRETAIGKGTALAFQQRFGGLLAAPDGRINLGVKKGKIAFVSSSIAPSASVSGTELSPKEAVLIAADDAELSVDAGDISSTGAQRGWDRFKSEELTHTQLARLVAVPTPQDGIRAAYQTFVFDNEPEATAFTHFIDAETGAVLIRYNDVDHLQEEEEDDPSWLVFPNVPPLDYSSTDTRELWCWFGDSANCERILENDAARVPWDVDARTGTPTFTSRGNQARATENWFNNNPFSVGVNFATPRPERDYEYEWTNQWFEERCNPNTTFTSPERNDIDAAIGNLFAMHNRMHDWSYYLGFTEVNYNLQDFNFGEGGRENDPEHGNAQAGGVTGGPPGYQARDNANQITPPDGSLPITNMYLWQPIPGGFYSPCVDGDYDMSVIGHEYTHAITNRMVGGPDAGLSGTQARSMGESWSDLVAIEYLQEYDFVPVADENPFAVGPYVTGDKNAGIRNYGMNDSPLNYSNIGYDITGPQVHADGEIWSAVNYEIRDAFN